jgi:hypothetical protein
VTRVGLSSAPGPTDLVHQLQGVAVEDADRVVHAPGREEGDPVSCPMERGEAPLPRPVQGGQLS